MALSEQKHTAIYGQCYQEGKERLQYVCFDISCISCSLKSMFLMLVSGCNSKGGKETHSNVHKSKTT